MSGQPPEEFLVARSLETSCRSGLGASDESDNVSNDLVDGCLELFLEGALVSPAGTHQLEDTPHSGKHVGNGLPMEPYAQVLYEEDPHGFHFVQLFRVTGAVGVVG